MSKRTLYIIIGTLALIFLVFLGIDMVRDDESEGSGGIVVAPADSASGDPGFFSSPDENDRTADWWTYENDRLGFEMKLPPFVVVEGGTTSPVAVYDNGKDDKVYIASRYFVDPDGKLRENSYELLDQDGRGGAYPNAIAWQISIKKIESEDELGDAVRERYGDGCEIGLSAFNQAADLYDVIIRNTGETSDCPLTYAYALKYSPARKKLAAWDLGQSVRFLAPADPYAQSASVPRSLDLDMANSFKFK